ncbi:FMN-linked oxidoreductase [Peniophora sp. CONT]|nr:FMN-linked oxidoreductase [Peniophora sp. CONT]
MSRRSASPLPEAREAKRRKIAMPLTPEDYKNGVVLAPMVRSSALPTRLMSLKYGAKLVWGPEIVDKAILHAKRVVDPVSGTISYMGQQSKAMFTCHPLEKPYFIFQIGSANPDLAVQAAKVVMEDVAGVELNCGCPKPFSTSGGMGAALLSTPDLLCSILSALRRELPPHISVSAKIRLLSTQDETKALVSRILDTGVNCLTIHCRTRSMRKTEPARIERMREIVEYIRTLGKDVAIVQNGDCVGYEDARKIRAITGADSCMIATAAESNPSVFSPTPLADLEQTLIPSYLRLSKFLNNHWASTKFSVSQFKGTHKATTKASSKQVREGIIKARRYEDVDSIVGSWSGEEELRTIERVVLERERNGPPLCLPMPVEELSPSEQALVKPQPDSKPTDTEPAIVSTTEAVVDKDDASSTSTAVGADPVSKSGVALENGLGVLLPAVN